MKRNIKRIVRKIDSTKLLMAIGIILIAALIITILTPVPKKYTFEEGFREIEALDKKYGANFKEERLNKTLVNFKNIDPYIKDLTLFRTILEKSLEKPPTEEERALLLFTDIRLLMLLSQKNYILGYMVGNKGLVTDEGFSCAESGYIINKAYYYNMSWSSGIQVYSKMDDLLLKYKNVPKVHELIGINENKAEFYHSPLGDIKKQVVQNIHALENYCFLNMSNGLKNTVNPEDYLKAPIEI
tara:strand:+ start:7850 stop:8575 length:726 start_codon:yes stop_codon:yes gene_type:complete